MTNNIAIRRSATRPATYTNRKWGNAYATLDEIRKIPVPVRTESYVPVPQDTLYTMWSDAMQEAGFTMSDAVHWSNGSQFLSICGITRDDLKINGVNADFHYTAGIMNSYDKTRAVSTGVGSEVFICTNGMFSAEVKLKTRHTLNVFDRLQEFVMHSVLTTSRRAWAIRDMFEEYSTTEVNMLADQLIDHVLVEAARQEIIPGSGIMEVYRHWKNPEHVEFKERNLWSLYNAFTSYNRGRSMFASADRYGKLHNLLRDSFHLENETPEELAAVL
jgi:hypothetical protein